MKIIFTTPKFTLFIKPGVIEIRSDQVKISNKVIQELADLFKTYIGSAATYENKQRMSDMLQAYAKTL